IDGDEPQGADDLERLWDQAQRMLAADAPSDGTGSSEDVRRNCETALAAVLVLCGGDHLSQRPDRARWCREALLAPLDARADRGEIEASGGMTMWEWPGFCADALPSLWADDPGDRRVRAAIAALATARGNEVVARLYAAVGTRRDRLDGHARQLFAFSIERA